MAFIETLAVSEKRMLLTRRKSLRHLKGGPGEGRSAVPSPLYPSLTASLECCSLEGEESQFLPHFHPFSWLCASCDDCWPKEHPKSQIFQGNEILPCRDL